MHPTSFIALNVFIAKLLETGTRYLTSEVPLEVHEPEEAPVAELLLEERSKPSWLLPYILTLQLCVICIFIQTLRKFELPNARTRFILIALTIVEFLFLLMDVLPFSLYSNYNVDLFGSASSFKCRAVTFTADVFQHLCMCLYLLFCSEAEGIFSLDVKSKKFFLVLCSLFGFSTLIPLSFKREELSDSCTLNQNLNIDMNFAQRLSSLHLLPGIIMISINLISRNKKKKETDGIYKMPTAKGDEELSLLNTTIFTRRSMFCHCLISLACFISIIGIKSKRFFILDFINKFDEPENILKKISYLHNAANSICLLTCMNFDDVSSQTLEDASETFEDSEFNDVMDNYSINVNYSQNIEA